MLKTIVLQIEVTRFVRKRDQIISGLCSNPCSMKAKAPIPIIRKVGRAIPSVLRVRIV